MDLNASIKKYLLKAMAILAIALTFMLLANHAVYMHIHVLDNGFVITHAHPFDKTSDNELPKKHKHSPEEILFFSALSLLFIGLMLIIGWKLQELKSYRFSYRDFACCIALANHNYGRAPPFPLFS